MSDTQSLPSLVPTLAERVQIAEAIVERRLDATRATIDANLRDYQYEHAMTMAVRAMRLRKEAGMDPRFTVHSVLRGRSYTLLLTERFLTPLGSVRYRRLYKGTLCWSNWSKKEPKL